MHALLDHEIYFPWLRRSERLSLPGSPAQGLRQTERDEVALTKIGIITDGNDFTCGGATADAHAFAFGHASARSGAWSWKD